MQSLQEFDDVYNNLKSSKKSTIIALHKFIFENEGDRSNRKRLREFTGFNYKEDTIQYTEKIKYVTSNLNSADLTSICNILNLDYNKDDLARYIFKNLLQNELLKDAIVDDDGDEEDEEGSNDGSIKDGSINDGIEAMSIASTHTDVDSNMQRRLSMNSTVRRNDDQRSDTPRFFLNFRDVEDTMNYFDGSGSIPVEKWISNFEETASLMYWDDFQRMIFARKSLKGLAKMFIMSENIKTWAQLKGALLSEFKCVTNSAQIHKLLRERKMKKDESIRQYFYNMREIAARGSIESDALIQYVIDGVNDLHANKVILYGATNLEEFKKKMQDYENFVSKKPISNEGKTFNKRTMDVTPEAENRSNSICYNCGKSGHKSSNCENKNKAVKCFNCGKPGHISANCLSKNLGPKCFKCNKHGHLASACSKKDDKTNTDDKVCSVAISTPKKYTKIVKIGGHDLQALIDTGSDLTLMRDDVHEALGSPQSRNLKMKMMN